MKLHTGIDCKLHSSVANNSESVQKIALFLIMKSKVASGISQRDVIRATIEAVWQ